LSEANPDLAKKFPIIGAFVSFSLTVMLIAQVAHGTLIDNRTPENQDGGYIHYMVTTFLHGVPVSDVFDGLTREQVKKFARELGAVMKEVHQLRPEKEGSFEHFLATRWEHFILERYDLLLSWLGWSLNTRSLEIDCLQFK
jgi:hypothetical protein